MQKTQQTLPIIPWMGGKRRLAKHLLPMFPEHSCYVELFSGGAALFFMRPTPAKVEVLNDINGQLINLYRVVQHHFDEFVRQFEWSLTSREVFARLQSTPPDCMTDIQRAARFFYLQHNAFGGKTIHQHFGTATTSKAWDASQIKAKLKAAKDRLKGVYIEHEPWERCLKRYDREHTFFYADPPYWQAAGYDALLIGPNTSCWLRQWRRVKVRSCCPSMATLISGSCLKIFVLLNWSWLIP